MFYELLCLPYRTIYPYIFERFYQKIHFGIITDDLGRGKWSNQTMRLNFGAENGVLQNFSDFPEILFLEMQLKKIY